jgi:nickel-dependent lactate racemase
MVLCLHWSVFLGKPIKERTMYTIAYGEESLRIDIPEEECLFYLTPNDTGSSENEAVRIRESLLHPHGTAPLKQQVRSGMSVAVLIDDITRPTPQRRILPVVLEELACGGISDKDIIIIVALGTHEYMTEEEIRHRVGNEVFRRYRFINHEWKNPENFVDLGVTTMGSPVFINRIAYESDFLLGIGSIVPHCEAGWSGVAKIVQPGICSPETTAHTHLLAVYPECLEIAGQECSRCREAMEQVAQTAGLKFIVNVVVDSQTRLVEVVSGDAVAAQRAGIPASRRTFERPIPALADILIVSANPGDIDYWQGIKALAHGQRAVREGGTVILAGPFPRGVSTEHPEMELYGTASYAELETLLQQGKIKDIVNASTLFPHALIRERCRVICLSDRLSPKQCEALGFDSARDMKEALRLARAQQGPEATIGIIDYGSDVLPVLLSTSRETR